MEQSNRSNRLSGGGIGRAAMIYLPAKIVEGLIGVWTLSYTADCLSHEAYDRFSSVNTIVVFINLLLIGWITNSAARYAGDYDRTPKYPGFCTTTASLWCIPNLATLAVCAIICAVTHSFTAYAAFFMLAATSLYQIACGILVLTGHQIACAAVSITSALAKPGVMWLTVRLLTGGVESDRILPAVAGYALSELLAGLAAAIVLKFPQNLRFRGFSGEVAKKFAAYGIPLLGVSVSVGLLNMVDRFIIMIFAGEYGIYNANNTISSTVFTLVNTGIMRAVYPSVLESFRHGGAATAKPLLNKGARLYLLIAAPAAAGLCGIGHQLSAFIYRSDPHYVSGFPVIGIVACALVFSGLNEYAIKTWELRAQTVPIMQNALIAVAVKIAASCALLPLLGFTGAGIGSLIGFITYFCISYFRARKTLAFSLTRRTVISIVLGSLACATTAWLVCSVITAPFLAILCAIPVGAVSYAVVLLVSGELKNELVWVKGKLGR